MSRLCGKFYTQRHGTTMDYTSACGFMSTGSPNVCVTGMCPCLRQEQETRLVFNRRNHGFVKVLSFDCEVCCVPLVLVVECAGVFIMSIAKRAGM